MSTDIRKLVVARMSSPCAYEDFDKDAGWRDWARGGLRVMGNVGGSIGGGIAGTAASAATGGTLAIPMAIGGGAAGGLTGDAVGTRLGNWLFGPEEQEQTPAQPQPQPQTPAPTPGMPTTSLAPKTAGARTMTNLDRMAASAAFDRLGIVLPEGMDKEAWINMALQGARLANTGVGRGVGKALQWGGQQLGKLWAGGGAAVSSAGKGVLRTGGQRSAQLKALGNTQEAQIKALVGQGHTAENAARMVQDSTGHIAKMAPSQLPGQGLAHGGVGPLKPQGVTSRVQAAAGEANAGLEKKLLSAGSSNPTKDPTEVFNTMTQGSHNSAPPPGFLGQHGNTLLTAGMMATMAPALIPMGGGGGEAPPQQDFGKMSAARWRTPQGLKALERRLNVPSSFAGDFSQTSRVGDYLRDHNNAAARFSTPFGSGPGTISHRSPNLFGNVDQELTRQRQLAAVPGSSIEAPGNVHDTMGIRGRINSMKGRVQSAQGRLRVNPADLSASRDISRDLQQYRRSGVQPPAQLLKERDGAVGAIRDAYKGTGFGKASSVIEQLAYEHAMRKVAEDKEDSDFHRSINRGRQVGIDVGGGAGATVGFFGAGRRATGSKRFGRTLVGGLGGALVGHAAGAAVGGVAHMLRSKKKGSEKKSADIGLAGLASLKKPSAGPEVAGRGFFPGELMKLAAGSLVKRPQPTTVFYKRPGGAKGKILSTEEVQSINAANAAKRKGPAHLNTPESKNTGVAYDGMTSSESRAAAANRTRVVSKPGKGEVAKKPTTSKPADLPVAGTPPLAQVVPASQIPVAHPVPLAQPVAPARKIYPPPPAPMPPRATPVATPPGTAAVTPEHRSLSRGDLAGAAVGLSGMAGLAGLVGYHVNRQGETSLGGPGSPPMTSPTYAQPQFNTIGPTLSSPMPNLGVSSMGFPGMTRFASAGHRDKVAFLDELKAHWQGLAPEHKVMTGLGGAAALGSLANGIRQGESGTGNTLLGLGGLAAGAYGLSGGKPLEALQGIAGGLGKAFGREHTPVPSESGQAGLASLTKDPKLSKYFDGGGNVNMMSVVKAPDDELRAGLAGISPKHRTELSAQISGFKPGLTHRIGAKAMGIDIDGQKERLGKLLNS